MSNFSDLIDGYYRFRGTEWLEERERWAELAEGQSPRVMVIACSDSRVEPATIFGSRPGEIFVVRNVANLVPPYTPDGEFHGTSAALEFAVQALKVKHIVVMGHGRCGGINAALHPGGEPLSPGDFIGKWMSLIEPLAQGVAGNEMLTDSEKQTALERISIRMSLANLRTFPCVSILEGKGRLSLHGAWFDISTGELWAMDAQTGDFQRPLVDVDPEPVPAEQP